MAEQMHSSLNLAVVGAGAAGLVAARELLREGHEVIVFERGESVGGTWVYDPETDQDPMGADPTRRIVHSSLYASLRTNLPREIMGFLDYPFVPRGDGRRFPGHAEVRRYLDDFARDFGLRRAIRFETEVVRVERDVSGKKWVVGSRKVMDCCGDAEEVFDGVVVCNGHYTEPRIAEIPGGEEWPGKQLHSHNYRVPVPFSDQVVVVVGSATSGADISREIASIAKEVHIASKLQATEACSPVKVAGYDNLWLHSLIKRCERDGSVVFDDGSSFVADVIIHCTGYKYHFPFLDGNDVVTVDDNCVSPLYKQVFPPGAAPGISFIGIPFRVAPFPLWELQSKWVAGVLSGRIELPTKEQMMDDIQAFSQEVESLGWPKRYTHNFQNIQFEYMDWLSGRCGLPPVEKWRRRMFDAALEKWRRRTFDAALKSLFDREEWEDDEFFARANYDFHKHL